MFDVSEDEIIVVSAPGNCAVGVADSVDVI
jgi:hypothetical protein